MQVDDGMLVSAGCSLGSGVVVHFGDAFQVATGVQGRRYEGMAEGIGRQLAARIDFGFPFGALERAHDPFDRPTAPGGSNSGHSRCLKFFTIVNSR